MRPLGAAPCVVPLNTWQSRGTVAAGGGRRIAMESRYGMLSYPNYREPDKALKVIPSNDLPNKVLEVQLETEKYKDKD